MTAPESPRCTVTSAPDSQRCAVDPVRTLLDAALTAQKRADEAREALELLEPGFSCDILADHRGVRWGFDPNGGTKLDVLYAVDDFDDAGELLELETDLAKNADVEIYEHDDLTVVSVYGFERYVTLYVFTTALRRDGAQ